MMAKKPTLVTLPIDEIHVQGDNVRTNLGDLEELKSSIETIGLLQPLVVQTDIAGYILVCGHRRLEAAKQVGRTEVPVIVVDVQNEAERLAVMLAENVARRSLTPVEIGQACKRLRDEHDVNQYEIAELLGCSQGHVSKCIQLLDMPDEIQELVHEGKMGVDTALKPVYEARSERRADRGRERGWSTTTKRAWILGTQKLMQIPGAITSKDSELIAELATLYEDLAENELVQEVVERRRKGAA